MRPRTMLPVLTAILVAITASASHFAARNAREKKLPTASTTSTSLKEGHVPNLSVSRAVGSTDEAPSDIRVVLLALRSEGFEPQEIQLAAGEYLFVVRNRTGLDEVNVRLLREANQQLATAKVRARQRDWKQRLQLTPGTYVLTESGHPEWSCRIVVLR